MSDIRFGTDGWRAIIAEDFTVDNVARVSLASALWVEKNFQVKRVVVGHDCRFAGELFAETVARVFLSRGFEVIMGKGFVSTPMVSLATLKTESALGIIITASHNPSGYNGFKLKGHYGGPLTPDKVQEIEDMIPEHHGMNLKATDLDGFRRRDMLEDADLEQLYMDHVAASFDLDAIRNSGLRFAYDAMYGAGQNVMKRLFPEALLVHCEHNPLFGGVSPEPIARNLEAFIGIVKQHGNIDCALVTDGDADRIGLVNGKGEFVDSHHIMLLLLHYLSQYKNMTGKVLDAFSCTPRIGKMARKYGFEHATVKIGFKYICGIMIEEDVLIGGEESGGIAVKGHIPERDGIWMGLLIWEFMAKTGKSLDAVVKEVYDAVGSFAFERIDLKLTDDQKVRIMEFLKKGGVNSFGKFPVTRVEDLDGYKFFLNNEQWVMIRPSGTEPVLRTYAESSDQSGAFEILKETHNTILNLQ
jgi:phosphomannomutase